MTYLPHILADASSGGLLGALGIDWKALVLNAVAFLIILGLLGKYVYPTLLKALDKKADELASATKQQQAAADALDKANQEAHEILVKTRLSADEMIASAKTEAEATLAAARDKATAQADRIVAEAREQLTKDVQTARAELRAETAMLVASATETVLGEKLTGAKDEALIERSLREAK